MIGKEKLVQYGRLILIIIVLGWSGIATAQLSSADLDAMQSVLKPRGATFEIGPNTATQLDLNKLCGLKPPRDWQQRATFRTVTTRLALPRTWNWCDQGGCTAVKNQGSCGACWAFATVGVLESNILIKDSVEEDLSEQYLVSCNTEGWGCDGGWWAHVYHQFKYAPPETEAGAVPEIESPYFAADVPCTGPYSHPWQISQWFYIGSSDSVPAVSAIKQAILDHGPVSVAIHAGPYFQAYTGGVFNLNETGDINHGVVLVGWDDSQGSNGVWILRNSWGPGWGEDGYMRIEYGVSKVGYAASYVIYPGQTPKFQLRTQTPGPFYPCCPGSLQVQVDVTSFGGFTDPVTLSLTGLPAGTSGNFSINPVSPPGSSMLNLKIQPSAVPGSYTITVAGEAGERTDELPLTLYITETPPSPPALLEPVDGETHAGLRNIAFSWSAVKTAETYRLQVAQDMAFGSPEADVPGIPATSYPLPGPLAVGTTYYWRVSSANGCGEGNYSPIFSFVANPKTVLLVDDDDNAPDVRSYYESALQSLGYSYDIWDTHNSDNEPAPPDLSGYKVVVWFSGAAFGGPAGPGAAGEAALGDYLAAGGRLFISSQDYHFDKGLTDFMQSFLGVQHIVSDDGLYPHVSGANDFAGLGPYALSWPFPGKYPDIIVPGSGNVAFEGDSGNVGGVNTRQTVFMAFPWEAVANNLAMQLQSSNGNDLLKAVLDLLGRCQCDLNHDATCNIKDWQKFIKEWDKTYCKDRSAACECDLNLDGRCNISDYQLFIQDWGRTDCPRP